jgi:hypothetical protein
MGGAAQANKPAQTMNGMARGSVMSADNVRDRAATPLLVDVSLPW